MTADPPDKEDFASVLRQLFSNLLSLPTPEPQEPELLPDEDDEA